MSQNDLLSSHISMSSSILCPTHYCVQHIIVSNKMLCPNLPKGSFVHISHVNMLWQYHAALAKHLSFKCHCIECMFHKFRQFLMFQFCASQYRQFSPKMQNFTLNMKLEKLIMVSSKFKPVIQLLVDFYPKCKKNSFKLKMPICRF